MRKFILFFIGMLTFVSLQAECDPVEQQKIADQITADQIILAGLKSRIRGFENITLMDMLPKIPSSGLDDWTALTRQARDLEDTINELQMEYSMCQMGGF